MHIMHVQYDVTLWSIFKRTRESHRAYKTDIFQIFFFFFNGSFFNKNIMWDCIKSILIIIFFFFTIKDLLFDRSSRRAPKIAEISQKILSRFGLSRSRFTGYDNALWLFQYFHIPESFITCEKKKITLRTFVATFPRVREYLSGKHNVPIAKTCGGVSPRDFPW